MGVNINDTRFFTNEEGKTLLDRFTKVLSGAEYFDVLVGFFRASGFFKLYKSLDETKKIRILVGINIDRKSYDLIKNNKLTLPFERINENIKKDISKEYIKDVENSDDKKEIEEGVYKFIEFINNKKMQIRAYPTHKIHAKIYIIRYGDKSPDFGRVITGSSNFSESGFVNNIEFNVELKDAPDVKFALEKFELLWKNSVDVSEAVVATIKQKTYLNDEITPYEIYLKFLYEYFKEMINLDKEDSINAPKGYLNLLYQKEAVVYAAEILKKYNGVFLSDVVGLGKTYIAAMLAKYLKGRSIVITPPVLKSYWEEVFREFGVSGHYIESYGKLEHILEKIDLDRYSNIFVDESHLFRNQITENFLKLHEICAGKKVILVSATPINNSPQDIASQIYLFQPRFRSNLPGLKNLYKFFKNLDDNLKKTKNKKEYIKKAKENSAKLRERILKYLMVRRTRTDIKKIYKEDIKSQKISFPDVKSPNKVYYQFTENVGELFDKTINTIKDLKYARYKPADFLKKDERGKDFQSARVAQGNLIGFIKSILLKRLESSFYAFKKTIERVLESHNDFLKMINKTKKVYISKKVDIFKLLETINEDNMDEIIKKAVEEKKKAELLVYDINDFNEDFIPALTDDIKLLEELKDAWFNIGENEDSKIDMLISILKEEIENQNYEIDRKVVIFTESQETEEYLGKRLSEEFGEETVIAVSSQSSESDMNLIRENFDPLSFKKDNTKNILITTDVLSEGVNLHRANFIINYDIPWNSTKILQRVGRVNRIGTKHKEIFIYNFFPTERTSDELSLEKLAIAKMQAFQEAMGEDAQYLTDEEEVSSHELFERINSSEYLEDESEISPELNYLSIIRDVRDKESKLFKKIVNLPKKSRTAREDKNIKNSLITFFRQGQVKRFFIAKGDVSEELDFIEAAKVFKVKRATPRKNLTDSFHPLLELNKEAYKKSIEKDREAYETMAFPPNSNEFRTLFLIKTIKKADWLTESDKEYLKDIFDAVNFGYIPKKKLKDVIKQIPEIKPNETIQDAYKILINELPPEYIKKIMNETFEDKASKKEVILSEELI